MLWKLIGLLLVLVVILALAGAVITRRQQTGQLERQEMLQGELDSLKVYLDHLAGLLKEKPGLSSSEIRRFRDKGLEDPVAEIKESLQKQKELIPVEGVMGGTMDFHAAHVLTSRWVLAYFEDGHVGGHMLLEYDVSDEGEISWKLIRARME
jgi:hypothetical protein